MPIHIHILYYIYAHVHMSIQTHTFACTYTQGEWLGTFSTSNFSNMSADMA